jgi:hypothetical protein
MQHAMHLGITADDMKALLVSYRHDRLTFSRWPGAQSPHAGRGRPGMS